MPHTHRFNGVPINLDTLNQPEVFALNRYAHQHLTQALGEVATLNQLMAERGYFGIREVPEFGEPMTSFEHDPFGDLPPQEAA